MTGAAATLRTLIEGLAARGERIAVLSVLGDRAIPLSYAELGGQALRLARGLVAAGIGPGEPVVLIGPNTAAWITVRLGLAAAGALAVALDDLSSDAELATLVPDSGAVRVFAATAHVPRLRALPRGDRLAIHRLDGPPLDSLSGDDAGGAPHWSCLLEDDDQPLPPLRPDDPQMLVYTSGTTGLPKSFLLSHANLLHNIGALLDHKVVSAADRVLLPLPFHHVYPLTVGILTALAGGSTLVLPEAVAGPQLVQALTLGRVTVLVAVPRLYAALLAGLEARVAARGPAARAAFRALLGLSLALRRRFGLSLGKRLFAGLHRRLAPDLWLMASGGARFEADLIWTLEALGWDVRSGYGLAETGSILTCNHGGVGKRIGSEGRPLGRAELRIVEPDEHGIGEIQTRGPSVFEGYRNDPQANAAAFTADGWFRTGDLGFVDADGFVFICGRVKEMIVLGGGKNVFPEELEKVYFDSMYIREVAVLEQNGALVALVVPDFEAIARSGNLRVEDVLRVTLTELSQRLPGWQRIAGYAISRDLLPRTRLGKYQRFLLNELYARAKAGAAASQPAAPPSPADRALLEASPGRELWDWLQARYPGRTLRLDLSPQLDLGIDSLEWVTITLELAERFGIRFAEEDAVTLFTLRDFLTRAAERQGAAAAEPPAGAAPPGPGQAAWLEPPGPGYRLLGEALYAVNLALMRGLFRLRVIGAGQVPAQGPLVIACNHVSDLDPLIVAGALGRARLAQTWWSGDAGRLFDNAAGRTLARAAHIFPVDERRPGRTLAFAADVLKRRHILIWFPESWRSPTGELQRFLPGIGHLLLESGARVVPARIAGSFEAMPRNRRLPRLVPLQIAFGPPLDPAALAVQGSGETDAARIAAALHDAVAALPGRRV